MANAASRSVFSGNAAAGAAADTITEGGNGSMSILPDILETHAKAAQDAAEAETETGDEVDFSDIKNWDYCSGLSPITDKALRQM